MDYEKLIDAETWAFIRRTGEFYPPEAVDLSIVEQRQVYDRMCRAFHRGYPDSVTAQDDMAGTVPVRVYDCGESAVTVLYFHGGGFVVGGLESHDDVCAEICSRTGYRVVSADYRLAPEHKHPAQFDDAWEALLFVSRNWSGPVVLAGDSAGGNLAAVLAHHARGRVEGVVGQVLIYPALGGDTGKGSYIDHANAPMLTRAEVRFYSQIRHSGGEPKGDPTCEPLADSDFAHLPPAVIITAGCDPLRDDGRDYRDRVVAAGGQAHWHDEGGLVHGYLRARASVKRAAESFDRIVEAVAVLGQGDWIW